MSEKITSPVHRGLEAKTKILGMEAYDLFFVLILACVMDLIVGHTVLREYFEIITKKVFYFRPPDRFCNRTLSIEAGKARTLPVASIALLLLPWPLQCRGMAKR